MSGWICPFCNYAATIQSSDRFYVQEPFTINNKHGDLKLNCFFTVCPNPGCKEFTFSVHLSRSTIGPEGQAVGPYKYWRLIPESRAKVFPAYIPAPILQDYREACLIRDLSPKASATLARRALQGMIREYWGVRKSRLTDEIEGIKDRVDPLTWEAIDAVRTVGNIGAHMEKDINLIVDVEPNESNLLIELIETLLRDWYITRHDRESRLKAVVALKETKEDAKSAPPTAEGASPAEDN